MSRRAFVRGQIASGFLVSVLLGCSGGSGNKYTAPIPMTSSMPTVSFSSPAQATTINLGQAITTAWTSTNATSCSAMSSSASGGTFSGAQSSSGTLTVVPTSAGSYVYTLTCTGAGGTVSVPAPTVTVNPSILSTLSVTNITTIGSTIDPTELGGNPYGLAIAPLTAGLVTAGDLVI
jgi:hypothetical protein